MSAASLRRSARKSPNYISNEHLLIPKMKTGGEEATSTSISTITSTHSRFSALTNATELSSVPQFSTYQTRAANYPSKTINPHNSNGDAKIAKNTDIRRRAASIHKATTSTNSYTNQKKLKSLKTNATHLYRTRLCQTLEFKKKCLNDNCRFAHSPWELCSTLNKFKTSHCRYGLDCVQVTCRYIHIPEEPMILNLWLDRNEFFVTDNECIQHIDYYNKIREDCSARPLNEQQLILAVRLHMLKMLSSDKQNYNGSKNQSESVISAESTPDTFPVSNNTPTYRQNTSYCPCGTCLSASGHYPAATIRDGSVTPSTGPATTTCHLYPHQSPLPAFDYMQSYPAPAGLLFPTAPVAQHSVNGMYNMQFARVAYLAVPTASATEPHLNKQPADLFPCYVLPYDQIIYNLPINED